MMKLLAIFALLLQSGLALSEVELEKSDLIPLISLNYFQNNVDVTITNFEDFDYLCSGFIYMTLQSGTQDMRSYHEHVFARSTNFQNFRTFHYNDRIVSAYHTIRCF